MLSSMESKDTQPSSTGAGVLARAVTMPRIINKVVQLLTLLTSVKSYSRMQTSNQKFTNFSARRPLTRSARMEHAYSPSYPTYTPLPPTSVTTISKPSNR